MMGIGISSGYATLGTIGFEGRLDYAAIGNVTNLASRLCGKALRDINIAGFSSAFPIYEVLGPVHKIRLDEALGRFTKSWKKKIY